MQEITDGTGEECILQLQAEAKTPDGFSTYLNRIVPEEIKAALLKYKKK